jgi:hypothetical protein
MCNGSRTSQITSSAPPDTAKPEDVRAFQLHLCQAGGQVDLGGFDGLVSEPQLVTVQTGVRLSEVTGLRREDVSLGAGAHVSITGKGRKERRTPLTSQTCPSLKRKRVTPHVLRHYVAFGTMSRAFYFSVVFCRNITDLTRHSPAPSIRLVPGGTCSDINLTGLATVAGTTAAPQSASS